MTFYHRLLATDGLYPGAFTGYSCSVLGVFDVYLSIPNLGYSDLEYKVTIVVRYKDKRWEYSKFVSYFTLKGYEYVTMAFNKFASRINSLRVSFMGKKSNINDTHVPHITAKIKQKNSI